MFSLSLSSVWKPHQAMHDKGDLFFPSSSCQSDRLLPVMKNKSAVITNNSSHSVTLDWCVFHKRITKLHHCRAFKDMSHHVHKKQLNKMHLCCSLREGRKFLLLFFLALPCLWSLGRQTNGNVKVNLSKKKNGKQKHQWVDKYKDVQ